MGSRSIRGIGQRHAIRFSERSVCGTVGVLARRPWPYSILSYPEFLAFSDPKYVKRSKKATHLKPSHTRPGWHKRGARQDRGTIASRPRATSKKPGRAETKGVCIRLVFSLRSSTFFDVRGVPMDKFLLTSSPRSLPVNY